MSPSTQYICALIGVGCVSITCAFISALHDSGPYYTHLGTACSEDDIRRDFENKGFEKKNIRIETVINAPREGKSSQGCPIAKYVSH